MKKATSMTIPFFDSFIIKTDSTTFIFNNPNTALSTGILHLLKIYQDAAWSNGQLVFSAKARANGQLQKFLELYQASDSALLNDFIGKIVLSTGSDQSLITLHGNIRALNPTLVLSMEEKLSSNIPQGDLKLMPSKWLTFGKLPLFTTPASTSSQLTLPTKIKFEEKQITLIFSKKNGERLAQAIYKSLEVVLNYNQTLLSQFKQFVKWKKNQIFIDTAFPRQNACELFAKLSTLVDGVLDPTKLITFFDSFFESLLDRGSFTCPKDFMQYTKANEDMWQEIINPYNPVEISGLIHEPNTTGYFPYQGRFSQALITLSFHNSVSGHAVFQRLGIVKPSIKFARFDFDSSTIRFGVEGIRKGRLFERCIELFCFPENLQPTVELLVEKANNLLHNAKECEVLFKTLTEKQHLILLKPTLQVKEDKGLSLKS